MSQFKTTLRVEHDIESNRKILVQPLVYVMGSEEFGKEYVVPVGFPTDFASVPRVLWWLIAPDGNHTPAAVVHDYLYCKCIDGKITRAWADLVFLDGMTCLKVGWLKRKVMYWAVRMFGGFHMALTSKKK